MRSQFNFTGRITGVFNLIAVLAVFSLGQGHVAAEGQGWPRTLKHEGGSLTLKSKPVRIVSTTPTITGTLLYIGAPVVASAATTPSGFTDDKGFFSQWSKIADERGVKLLYPALKFDLEAIIIESPDLVIASSTGADSVLQHKDALAQQQLPTLVLNYSNQSWQQLAMELGVALGREKEAAEAINVFDAHVGKMAKTMRPPSWPVSVVGYNIGGSYSVARLTSPVARLMASLGFSVVGLPPQMAADKARLSDFEFVSRENLSAATAGETVFLLRATQKDVDAFLADPLLANHPAVVSKRVYPLGLTSMRIDPYSAQQIIERLGSYFPPS